MTLTIVHSSHSFSPPLLTISDGQDHHCKCPTMHLLHNFNVLSSNSSSHILRGHLLAIFEGNMQGHGCAISYKPKRDVTRLMDGNGRKERMNMVM
ncbi:hypothetical protein RvY_03351 [Ramazzottius varieornatus]|uniref:Uncharacterized protein n=1 Tax=Ramazzottius varieornatus TaxID=947166 RepID=A0A1D1UX59_RAMVA|nr:hypothetical protein RvY_03351 [Ramazzottius varieornatus]